MSDTMIEFEPIPLLDRILTTAEIPSPEQETIFASFRTLTRNRLATEILQSLPPIDQSGSAENLEQEITQLEKEISKSVSPKKAKEILTMVLLSVFLDVTNNILENMSPQKTEKINQVLDQDRAFRAIFRAWEESQRS